MRLVGRAPACEPADDAEPVELRVAERSRVVGRVRHPDIGRPARLDTGEPFVRDADDLEVPAVERETNAPMTPGSRPNRRFQNASLTTATNGVRDADRRASSATSGRGADAQALEGVAGHVLRPHALFLAANIREYHLPHDCVLIANRSTWPRAGVAKPDERRVVERLRLAPVGVTVAKVR